MTLLYASFCSVPFIQLKETDPESVPDDNNYNPAADYIDTMWVKYL